MVIELILVELSGQVLVIKRDDSREGESHRVLINRTSHLKSGWGSGTEVMRTLTNFSKK